MSKIGQSLIDAESEDFEDHNEPDFGEIDENEPSAVDEAMVDLDRSMKTLNDNRGKLHHYGNELKLYAKRLIELAGIANRKLF